MSNSDPQILVDDPKEDIAFDRDRPLADKAFYSACYAPHTSLFFDQLGDVRACCHNLTGTLGNIRRQSIREIWDGAQANRLRQALERRDLSEGCGHCAWQEESGSGQVRFSRNYDGGPVSSLHPRWPRQMEFSLTNACNLQCRMCTGWNSSAIRAHREGLPPMAVAYGEGFFEELAVFLPHLEHVTLLGGEPFLGAETLRVLEMIAALDRKPSVWITTNGTQWTPRVRRILDRVPVGFEFSLDGATRETYESVRVGSSFDTVIGNLGRYLAHARANGQRVVLSFCLMTCNWHELAAIIALSERHGLDDVKINVVTYPSDLSLYSLSASRLAEIVRGLRDQEAQLQGVERLYHVWEAQLGALEARVANEQVVGLPNAIPWRKGRTIQAASGRALLMDWSGVDASVLRGDSSMQVLSLEGPLADDIGTRAGELLGRPLPVMIDVLGSLIGAPLSPARTSSGLSNEFAFEAVSEGRVVGELRALLFSDGVEVVALLGLRRLRSSG